MILGRWLACFTALAVAVLLDPMIAGPFPTRPSAAALTNDEIVHMVVSGIAESEILDSIRSRPEEFDLADDMIEELKLAGVPSSILAAMAVKHANSTPSAPPEARPKRGSGQLVVMLNAEVRGSRTLRVPSWADEDARARFHLPKENDQRSVNDLAVFLTCTAPEHIPDLWRSKTPLGRDMNSVARHEILTFVAGDTPAGKQPRLTLPVRLEADLDDTEPHDLVLGIAARFGDRWMHLASAAVPKFVLGLEPKALTARIEHIGHGFDFKVELKLPRQSRNETNFETPASSMVTP